MGIVLELTGGVDGRGREEVRRGRGINGLALMESDAAVVIMSCKNQSRLMKVLKEEM